MAGESQVRARFSVYGLAASRHSWPFLHFQNGKRKIAEKEKKQQINRDLVDSIIQIHSPEEIRLYDVESFNSQKKSVVNYLQ